MKYFPLFWEPRQHKTCLYRIYLNIFALFLGIKFLPLKIDKFGIDLWYKGDTLIWIFPWKRKNKELKWISLTFSGNGDFGDAKFKSLKELNNYWDEFENFERNNLDNVMK